MADSGRLEKTGRSWKQQAHAHKLKHRLHPVIVSKKAAPAPSCSWWTETRSREEFQARAAAERERMSHSTFGRIRDMEKL
jgi:hypothetical protein